MIPLDIAFSDDDSDPRPGGWNVTMANEETHHIEGGDLLTEGGALVIRDTHGKLVVAFGPGAWLEVQRP